MWSRQLTGVLMCVVAVVWSATAQAEIIAQYSFTDVVPMTLNRSATTVAANATAGDVTDAPVVFTHPMVVLARSVDIGYATQPVLSASRAPWDEANLIENVYFSFEVSPVSGYGMDLDELTFNIARGGAATPRVYDIRSSIDGFASSLTGGEVAILTQRPTWTPVSIDLTGAAFQNLTSPLTFRMHYMGQLGQFGQNIDFDDITVNGTVAVATISLPGDYNNDTIVDAADYTVWRNNLNTNFDLNGNGDETGDSAGTVDEADYIYWKQYYGTSSGDPGSGGIASSAVPEPSSAALIMFVVACWGTFAKRR